MTFAFDMPQRGLTLEDLIRILAIIGGGAIGGFVTGFLTQAIVRGYTGQKVPRWVVWTLRLLGGVAMGWLVYLIVYGHGGSLFGGFGGGSGLDKDGGGPGGLRETTPAVTVPKVVSPGTVEQGGVLRVAVLGDDPLKKMFEAGRLKSFDPERCYLVADEEPATLRTLREIEKYILERVRDNSPPKRIEVILYKDSPQKMVPRVSELKKWADDLTLPGTNEKVIVDFKEPGEVAPVR
jgi:hypothetical protein